MENPFEAITAELSDIKSILLNLKSINGTPAQEQQIATKIIDEKELCKFLKISHVTAIRWRQEGKVPFFRIGNVIRYDLQKVLLSLEAQNDRA
jgi:hypothetical protein